MKESQEVMMQHSEVKVRLLKLYLERYLNVLTASKFFSDIYVYDLFCGEGVYDNGGKGSPIVILETIKNIYFASKANGTQLDKLNCLFNDIELWKLEKLQKEITDKKLHYPIIGNLKFSQIDYRNLLPQINSEINSFKKEKAFIFIDPYGYKDVKISDIKTLLQSNKSEVLLFLPTQFMFRFEKKGTPECLIEFINELMPIDQWPVSETGIDFIENLRDAFRTTLGNEYFVDSFIITRDKNQFFCLFFFTSHIYGFDRMLDAKWKIDEEEGRGWQHQNENSLFSQVQKTPNTFKFEKKLVEYLKTEKTNSEVYKFTLHNGHLTTHATEVLIKLQNEGRITVLKSDGTIARKSSFYISYKEHRDNPNKIKLRIK